MHWERRPRLNQIDDSSTKDKNSQEQTTEASVHIDQWGTSFKQQQKMIKVLAQFKSQYNLVYSESAMMIQINALRKKAKTQPK